MNKDNFGLKGNSASSGGTGNITGSGTPGTLAIFTGPSSIGDSYIKQRGSQIEVAADATIGGTIAISGGTPGLGKVLTATDSAGSAAWQDVNAINKSLLISGSIPVVNLHGNVGHENGQNLLVGATPAYDTFAGGTWDQAAGLALILETGIYNMSASFYHEPTWMGSPMPFNYFSLFIVNLAQNSILAANTTNANHQVDLVVNACMEGLRLNDGDQIALYAVNNLGQSISIYDNADLRPILANFSLQRIA